MPSVTRLSPVHSITMNVRSPTQLESWMTSVQTTTDQGDAELTRPVRTKSFDHLLGDAAKSSAYLGYSRHAANVVGTAGLDQRTSGALLRKTVCICKSGLHSAHRLRREPRHEQGELIDESLQEFPRDSA
jgi:hypothetical protein